MGKYRVFGTLFDKIFRNDLNANFTDVDTDIKAVDSRVSNIIANNPQPSEVVDARQPATGSAFGTLKARLDDNDNKIGNLTKNVLGNPNKIKGIAVTIKESSNSVNFSDWATKLSDIDCEIELCVMETISTDMSYDMTPVTDIASKVTQVKNTVNKPIRMIKPHIGTVALGDGFYRGTYVPSNVSAFFTNWGSRMVAYAQICKDNNIPVLCISCEQTLLTTSTYLSNWKTIITNCKTVYPDLKITVAYTRYESGRDLYEYNGVETLLDNVDIIGVNFYPYMLKTDPLKYMFGYFDTVNGIQANNNNTGMFDVDQQLIDLKKKFNKSIYITEIGSTFYTEADTDIIQPIYVGTTLDRTNQAIYIENVLKYLLNSNIVDGLFLWHMDTPFAIVNSPTKEVIKTYFNKEV